MKHCFYRYIILLLKKDKKKLRRDKPCNMKRPRAQRFLRKKKRASNITEASYRRYSNKKISTTFTLAGVLAASWQISYFLRRDCILRKREGRFSTLLFASPPYYIKLIQLRNILRDRRRKRLLRTFVDTSQLSSYSINLIISFNIIFKIKKKLLLFPVLSHFIYELVTKKRRRHDIID